MPKLLFSDWFVQQHGPRQRSGNVGGHYSMTDDEFREMKARGELATSELQRRELWDAKRTAALYAWQVDDK